MHSFQILNAIGSTIENNRRWRIKAECENRNSFLLKLSSWVLRKYSNSVTRVRKLLAFQKEISLFFRQRMTI